MLCIIKTEEDGMAPRVAKLKRLSVDEIIDLVERDAQRRMNISAKELSELYINGTLEDPSSVRDLLNLLDLLPSDAFYGKRTAISF